MTIVTKMPRAATRTTIPKLRSVQVDKQRSEFMKILRDEAVSCVFQPIVSLRDGSVLAYEGLSRGPYGTPFESPAVLIEMADRYGAVFELEYLFRRTILRTAATLLGHTRLFLNVNPNIIGDERFKAGFTRQYMEKYGVLPELVTFEITERQPIERLAEFKALALHYKESGYEICIDDAGAGYSGLNLISDVRPDLIKLDMNLIRGIDKDYTKQAMVKSMVSFANLTNTRIVAEGIETADELSALIDFDVHYGQGYYIQRPAADAPPIRDEVKSLITSENRLKNRLFCSNIQEFYVKNISRPMRTITPDFIVNGLEALFAADSDLQGVTVVADGNRPVGVVTRQGLYRQLGSKYGYCLFANCGVTRIMDTNFLSVEHRETIDVVAKKAMLRPSEKIYDFIVVVKNGKYHSAVTVKELLEKTIEIEVASAKSLNPLSGLPGNNSIEAQLERAIALELPCCVLYIDIDNFKPYNDLYGFENGDKVIKKVAEILRCHDGENRFIGHIGGDDFIAIVEDELAETVAAALVNEFADATLSFYNAEDAARGYVTVKNRKGIEESFPLLSISVAGVYPAHHATATDLAEYAAAVKKQCKQQSGNVYILSRGGKRNLPDEDFRQESVGTAHTHWVLTDAEELAGSPEFEGCPETSDEMLTC